MLSYFLVSLLIFAFCSLIMTLAFVYQRGSGNAGIVDVLWALLFTPAVFLIALFSDGLTTRKVLLLFLVSSWSLRLGMHLFLRYLSEPEDRRYQALRISWGEQFQNRLFGFYQMQALSVPVICLPFYFIASNQSPELAWLEWAGLILFTIAFVGESLADVQLRVFKNNPENHGRVCQFGLWRYTRHPNYFFEWLNWVAFALMALPVANGFLALLVPALMLHLILNVTGIPLTEEHCLKSKGEEYREYQRTTSRFFPWFPKN